MARGLDGVEEAEERDRQGGPGDTAGKGDLTVILLIDVKGAFDHVSKNGLMRKMDKLGADEDLIRRIGSFKSERKVSLVVDGHQSQAVEVDTRVPQGSPVSPTLFAVYLRGIFKQVEEEVEGCMTT